jgi:hypothetical protein
MDDTTNAAEAHGDAARGLSTSTNAPGTVKKNRARAGTHARQLTKDLRMQHSSKRAGGQRASTGTAAKALERLIREFRDKLNGTPGTIRPPAGDEFKRNGPHEVWGMLARQAGKCPDAETTRAAIENVLTDYPAAVAAEVWARLDESEWAVIPMDGTAGEGKPKVTIPLQNNDPLAILEQVFPHLSAAGVYQREGQLVRIVHGDAVKIRGVGSLVISGPMVDAHDVDSLPPVLCRTVDFQAEYVRGQDVETKPTTPRAALLRMLLRLKNWPGTPHLVGIASGPFMRHDGTVCAVRGYDTASGWYLDYDGEPVIVPEHPTRAQAEDACRALLALVNEFPWTSDSHKCGWLAYLLTLIARPGIEGSVRAFVFSASTPGAGKTLVANVANIIAYGHKASGYTAPNHSQDSGTEWKKALFSYALTGNPSLVIDNYPSGKSVGCAELDGVITGSKIIDRVMGKHEVKEAACVFTVAITGNNLGSTADFGDRSIWAYMEPAVENPRENSGFSITDLEGYARNHRAELLGKALTILRWHAANGYPSAGGKHCGSFEQWASTVRDAIMHLTGHDVTQNAKDAFVADQEVDELATLLSGLNEYFEWRKSLTDKQAHFTVAELYADLNHADNLSSWPELREVVDASLSQSHFNRIVGSVLPKHKGRVSNGLKLVVTNLNKKRYWRIVRVEVTEPPPN